MLDIRLADTKKPFNLLNVLVQNFQSTLDFRCESMKGSETRVENKKLLALSNGLC